MKYIIACTALLAGCASSGVVPMNKGTYMLSKQSAAGVFGTPEGVKADIYMEANAYCAKSGQQVETINLDLKGAIPFVRTGSAALEFRCVSAS